MGADLGQRLARAVKDFLVGGGTLVIVGSDAPLLSTAVMRSAHECLEAGDELVLVPDQGGGYCLVGLSRPAPELFTQVPMSTPDNLRRTRDRARDLRLRTRLLASECDVDRPEDLQRLSDSTRSKLGAVRESETPVRTFEILRSLEHLWS
jgi:glycosyltransferase A (GT-A) superfamily protein (DUF2064 family)